MSKPVSLLALLLVLLAGCAASAGNASGIRHNRNTLEWDVVGVSDVPTLDPALVSDPTSISVASLVYGGLVRLDSQLRVRPDGAASWSISPDGTVYTFHLRRHLRFASGRAVTAADFARALRRALGPAGSAGAASFYLGAIAHHSAIAQGETRTTRGIQVIDPKTLRITLSHPSAHFLAQLAYPTSYVPDPATIARYGQNWTDHAAGFGPYSVLQWNHTASLTLVPNRYYWGGKPAFRRILITFAGESQAIAAYRRGDVDIVSGLPAGESFPTGAGGVVRVPGLALDYLAFNTNRLPFSRLNARRAFAAAWKPSFVHQALGAAGFPAHAILPPGFGLSSPVWTPKFSPAAYLRRAHYSSGNDFPPIVLVVPRDPGINAMAQALAAAWQTRLNVNVQVRQLDPSIFDSTLASHRYDIAIVRWGADYADAQDFLGTQLGSSADNITGWTTRAYDGYLFLANSYQPQDSRRAALLARAAGLAAQKSPLVPLDEPAQTAIIRPSLRHVMLTALGTISGDWPAASFRR